MELDTPTAPAKRFVELDLPTMTKAGEPWRSRGSSTYSLDDAAAEVQGLGPMASVNRPPAAPSERRELDEAVQAFQRDHGGSYLTALEMVTGGTAVL